MSYKRFLSFVAITTLASSIILTGCGASTATSATSSTVTTTEATSSDDSTEVSEYFTERDVDYSYDESSATKVTLSDGETYTISEEGVYIFSGSVSNAQIVVDANETDKVQIVLDGLTMTNESTACIYGLNADKIFITTADGSTNSLSVTGEYVAIDDNNIDGVIFSKTDVTLNGGGTLNIEGATGHGVVSKDDLKVTCGNYNISVAKKGLEGKESVRIGGGSINITECYEGIESQEIILVDGEINITASDDGINAVSADDSSDNDGMAADGVSSITILGGTLYINASGDGIDSNNTLTISGGTIYVDGPMDSANGALDYAGSGTITGGTFFAVGSSGMAQNMGSDSTQGCILVNLQSNESGEIQLLDSDGNVIASYTPSKSYSSVLVSTAGIEDGATYTLVTGNTTTEITMDGLIYGAGGMMGGGFGGGRMGGGQGQMGQMPSDGNFQPGQMPQDGQRPELPEGEAPSGDFQPGQRPDMNESTESN